MKEIFDFLNYTVPIRRNKRTKVRFLTYLNNEYEEIGVSCKMWRVKKGMFRMYNLIAGNIATAENVILVGYDTPTKILSRNYHYYPINAEKNKINERKNTILQSALSVFIILCCIAAAYYISVTDIKFKIVFAVLLAGIALLSTFLMRGIPNGSNLNKNNAALAMAMKLVYDVNVKKSKTAVVFLDQTSEGYFGYKIIKEALNKELSKKNVIILECLACGEKNYLVTNCNKSNIKERNKIKNTFIIETLRKDASSASLVNLFDKCFYFFCGEKTDGELTVKNIRSKNDKYYVIENMEKIYEALKSYLSNR